MIAEDKQEPFNEDYNPFDPKWQTWGKLIQEQKDIAKASIKANVASYGKTRPPRKKK